MTAYKTPGVYATIKDISGVVANNNVTSAAYVGESEFGPVFKPTLCSNLQDYVNQFGRLNSRYGYAGYSLAVAAETINQHYFVRVVPVGNPEESEEARENNASWAAATILKKDSEAAVVASTGYWYEEITAAENARDAGLNSGLFTDSDFDSAFMVVATNPNNRKFFITVADSTINENRAYAVSAPTELEVNGSDESGYTDFTTTVTVTVPSEGFGDAMVDDQIVVSRMTNTELNGTWKITAINVDSEAKVAKISYLVNGKQEEAGDANARVGMYPNNNQTTFSVTVSEKVGRVITNLETFQYCTLYPAQDNYGNSMYIEDVINGSSDYIQVFVNKNFEEQDPDAIVVPQSISGVELTGGQSGIWDNINDKYKQLCAAWDLFKDRLEINVNLLLNSGYVLKGNTSYQAKMLEVAELRRDCFCLFDCPMTETDPEDLIDWRRNVNGMNTYRAAISAPWVKTYDSVQGRANFVMCPSAYIAKIMGAYDPWMAPAGLNRGILTASTVSPTGLTQFYNDTIVGNLYADNQINCILRNAASGYVNWGQRTLQQKPSALDRINVARTVIYIETVLRDAARWKVFENNNADTRMQITLQFSSFLDTILSQDGISGYRVVCDTSNNTPQVIANNQLKIDVYLQPTYCAEIILLQTTIEGALSTTTVSTSNN